MALAVRVSGMIEAMEFAPGAQVSAGQPLFVIEDDLYAAAVREAEGALRAAEADVLRLGAVLDRGRTNLSYTQITAPFDGLSRELAFCHAMPSVG